MRIWVFLIVLFSFLSPSFAQVTDPLTKHQISADIGSLRNRYFYPITDLKYKSPLLWQNRLSIAARLRSYNTLFFFNKNTYDFTPIAEYYFSNDGSSFYFSAGLGVDVRLRFANDERSEEMTSAEPLISLAGYCNYKRMWFALPLWTRFYSNGISFTILPEATYQFKERLGFFFRYEMSYLQLYKYETHEWRRDCFAGLCYSF